MEKHLFLRRMPEKNRVRQVMPVQNELIADPEQFLFVLIFECLLWIDARVNTQVIVGDVVRPQLFQKLYVLRRYDKQDVGRPLVVIPPEHIKFKKELRPYYI